VKSERSIVITLLIWSAVVRIGFLLISVNATSDGPPRAIYAWQWAQNPELVTQGHWLPLQLYLSGALLMCWDNLWEAPRVISLVFGVLAVWPLWRLMRQFFTVQVSFAASLLFIFWGLHIAQSIVSSSEAVFYFFAFWALFHFTRWWQTTALKPLALSALFWFPAIWTKPEAWWLAASCGLFLFGRVARDAMRQPFNAAKFVMPIVLFGGLVSLGPALWLLACHFQKGDALATFHRTASAIGESYFDRPWWYKASFWPVGLAMSLGPFVFPLGLWGVARSLKRRTNLLWIGFMLAYAAPLWLMMLIGQSGINVRHTMFVGILWLPLAAYVFEDQLGCAPRKFLAIIFVAAIAWLAIVLALGETRWGELSQKFASISPRPKERPHVTELTRWLRQQLKPTDRVLLDAFNHEESSLQFHLRLNPKQARICWNDKTPSEQLLAPMPRFVVYAKGDAKRSGTLSKALPLDAKAESQEKFGFRFWRRHENEVYVVFELERLAATSP
jgi:hypothetical protein